MINEVVTSIIGRLNDYLNLRAPSLKPEIAVAGNLVDQTGKLAASSDRVVLTVVNIDENRVYRSLDRYRKLPDGGTERVRPPARLDLTLLFTSTHTDYPEALKFLAYTISFFQLYAVFTVDNPEGEKARVQLELLSTSFEQQNHLWGSLGAKYLPSVLYRAGILEVRDVQTEGEAPVVQQIDVGS